VPEQRENLRSDAAQSEFQLFHSNVSFVQGNQVYLERPQIERLLEKAVEKPLITVVAGAGYGKTHSVYSFLRGYSAYITWIQLSERDNIGERFWENFTTTVRVVNPEAAAKLAGTRFPETERQFEHYIAVPSEEVNPGKKYVFVYDDFHLIQNKAVLKFLERSITSPFPNITSILISRSDPSINLMNFLSKGFLTQITEDELRFSREEMDTYFRIQNIFISPQVSSRIYRDTEGWAFAIHLAGLSLKNAPAGTEYVPQAMRSNIFRLIEQEIIAGISVPLRKFLIKLSLIDHLAPELLREIANDSPEVIAEMEAIGSFIQFDTYINTYRIHHLFMEYLSGKQDELSEEEKQDIWTKTAVWCAENNQKIDTINYYEKAGNYVKLIDIIYTTLPLMLPNNIARMLLEVFDRAPPRIYDEIPQASFTYTRFFMCLEMFDKATDELWKIINRLELGHSDGLPLSPAAHRALAGCYRNLGLVGIFTSLYTRDYGFTTHFEKALDHARQSGYQPGPPISVSPLSSYVNRSGDEKGEPERYLAALEKSVPFISASMNGATWGMDDLGWGELAMFRGDSAAAEPLLRDALRKAREKEQYEIENRALFYLLRLAILRGNAEEIPEFLKQLEGQLELPFFLNRFIYHDIVTGWFYIQTGRLDKPAPWLKDDFEESDLNSINSGLEILVKAKYHYAEKHYPAAIAVLKYREKKYGIWAFLMGKIVMLALESVCHYHLHNKKEAYRTLEEAYTLAEPNGLYLPFTELGKDMRTLASAALRDNATAIPRDRLEKIRNNASAYAKKLFAVAEQYNPPAPKRAAGSIAASLSPRESGVLTGLSQGLTREEIAEASNISLNTVKSVIRNVYNKLGALNRADAVRIATASGLLTEVKGSVNNGTTE
jgi:LuxR family maltose regulon positive regulatory protein